MVIPLIISFSQSVFSYCYSILEGLLGASIRLDVLEDFVEGTIESSDWFVSLILGLRVLYPWWVVIVDHSFFGVMWVLRSNLLVVVSTLFTKIAPSLLKNLHVMFLRLLGLHSLLHCFFLIFDLLTYCLCCFHGR